MPTVNYSGQTSKSSEMGTSVPLGQLRREYGEWRSGGGLKVKGKR